MRFQSCVGSVCVGDTSLMCRGREYARLGSTTRCVSFYASLVGGGLRLSRSHQEATVVFGYIEGSFLVSRTGDVRERYAPNIYRCIGAYTHK